jgi:hypothetical protein
LAGTTGTRQRPDWLDAGVGFVTNVFDTLGIGSFASTSAFFKPRGMVPDERIPGTLVVGTRHPRCCKPSSSSRWCKSI